MKKRKIESDEEEDRISSKERISEFRVRFLEALGFDSNQYNMIFGSSNLGFMFPREDLGLVDICNLLLKNEKNVKFIFEILLCNVWKKDKSMNERIRKLLTFYFGETFDDSITQKLLVLRGLRDAFFSGVWPEHLLIRFRRKEEENVLKEISDDSFTHVKIFGVDFSLDVAKYILSFMKHDRSLILSLGLVNMEWFQLVLSTWDVVTVTPFSCKRIPLMILRNVEIVKIVQQGFSQSDNFLLSNVDVDYLFSHLTLDLIREIDLQDFNEFGECEPPARKEIHLPNLTNLSLPHGPLYNSVISDIFYSQNQSLSPNLQKIFPFTFPKIRVLKTTASRFIGEESLFSKRKQLHELTLILERFEDKPNKLGVVEELYRLLLQENDMDHWSLRRLKVIELEFGEEEDRGDGRLHKKTMEIISRILSLSPELTTFEFEGCRPGLSVMDTLYHVRSNPVRNVRFPFRSSVQFDSFSLVSRNDIIRVEEIQFGENVTIPGKISVKIVIPSRDLEVVMEDWIHNYTTLSQIRCHTFHFTNDCVPFLNLRNYNHHQPHFHVAVKTIFESLPLAQNWLISFTLGYDREMFVLEKYNAVETGKSVVVVWVEENIVMKRMGKERVVSVIEKYWEEIEMILKEIKSVSQLPDISRVGMYFPKEIPQRLKEIAGEGVFLEVRKKR